MMEMMEMVLLLGRPFRETCFVASDFRIVLGLRLCRRREMSSAFPRYCVWIHSHIIRCQDFAMPEQH